MNDSGDSPMIRAQIQARENLFYFLRTLSKLAWPDGGNSREESLFTDEQTEECVSRNGILM